MAETAFHRALILFETKTPAPITVVVIDEASARRFNRDPGYPITFAGHATILSSILCSGPSSIFIDLASRSLRLKQGAYADVDAAGIPNEFNDLLTNLELRPGAEGLNCPLLNGPNGRSEPAPIIGVAHIVDAATRTQRWRHYRDARWHPSASVSAEGVRARTATTGPETTGPATTRPARAVLAIGSIGPDVTHRKYGAFDLVWHFLEVTSRLIGFGC
ncbi:MAG: hypothetical protein AAFR60_06310 [Pseudomonadota bacterium]